MIDPAERLAWAAAARDAAAIRDLIASLTEEERRPLVAGARALVAEAKRQEIFKLDLAPAVYAAYGVLGVTELRSLAWRARHLPEDLVIVLRGRPPERLEPIVTFLLEVVAGGGAWRSVRSLVREGVVPRPAGQAYTIGMLSATAWGDPATLIASDPGLADDEVWRLFEVEGGGEDSLANHEKFFGDRWGNWFRAQAAAYPSIRGRLLDASLAALARDFSAYRAGWFSRFHESLAPTDAERIERTAAYLVLLRSRIGPTVTLAVRALDRIRRAGALHGERLVDLIGPVLAEAPASTATIAIGFAERSGVEPERAATVLLDAFSHRSADVHGAALAAIDRLVPGQDAMLGEALEGRLGDIAASRRRAAATLVERLRGSIRPPGGVEAHHEGIATAVPARPTDPLEPSRAIVPIASVEELVERLAALLEDSQSPDELERVLDGISRLCAERPAGFDRLVGPIGRRARTLLGRQRPFVGYDPRADISALALSWVEGAAPPRLGVDRVIRSVGVGAFLSARNHELARRVAARGARTLYSAPTHRGGWIAPSSLVERARATGGKADRFDLVAALLRIGKSGRAEALRAAEGIPGEPAAAIRYALGGDEEIGPTAAWWIAAARVRSPDADDGAVERRHPGHGPDAGRVARVQPGPDPIGGALAKTAFIVEPPLPASIALDEPTVQQVSVQNAWSQFQTGRDLTLPRWIETVRPGYREPRAAVAARQIGTNVDWWTADWGSRVVLEPYLDAWTPIGPMARLLVGTALGQREAGERGLAADVVIAAIEDGRLDGTLLADGLARAAARGVDRPRRWAVALGDIAAASPAHATVVGEAIGRVLPAIADRRAADLIDLLRLLQELTAESGTPVDPSARDALTTLAEGGGRTGRIARELLG